MRWMNFLLFDNKPVGEPAAEQPRCITLADRIVPYTINRRRRRSLSLTIDHRGLNGGDTCFCSSYTHRTEERAPKPPNARMATTIGNRKAENTKQKK